MRIKAIIQMEVKTMIDGKEIWQKFPAEALETGTLELQDGERHPFAKLTLLRVELSP